MTPDRHAEIAKRACSLWELEGRPTAGISFRPESPGALQLKSEDWRRRAEKVFLAGYRAVIGDCSSFSRNEASFSHLIKKFVLEKSLYQIYYEAPSRLEWVHIPLAGAAKIICHGK